MPLAENLLPYYMKFGPLRAGLGEPIVFKLTSPARPRNNEVCPGSPEPGKDLRALARLAHWLGSKPGPGGPSQAPGPSRAWLGPGHP